MTKASSVEKHFDKVSTSYDAGKVRYSFYYSSLKKLLLDLIGKNNNVFEFGCGTGDLLTSLNPKVGYGMDISTNMVKIARSKHKRKSVTFSIALPKRKFDYIFMSDVIEHLEKPQSTFSQISKLMNKDSKFIITMANPKWEVFLMIWEKLGWKMPEGPHRRMDYRDIKILLAKSSMKIVKHDYRLLVPVKIPVVTKFANVYLERFLKRLAFIEYFVAVKS